MLFQSVNEFAVSTPLDTNLAANTVDENVAAGTVVGITAFASDADATTNAVSYSLTSNPGGLFAIDTNTGVITSAEHTSELQSHSNLASPLPPDSHVDATT